MKRESPRPSEAELIEAATRMAARRRELIAKPLASIWRDLAEAALTAPSQPASAVKIMPPVDCAATRGARKEAAAAHRETANVRTGASPYEGKAEPVSLYEMGAASERYVDVAPPAQPAPAVDREALENLEAEICAEYSAEARDREGQMQDTDRSFLSGVRTAFKAILALLAKPSSEEGEEPNVQSVHCDEGGKDAELVREWRDHGRLVGARRIDLVIDLGNRLARRLEALSAAAGEK
jgi:hypothetical protein